MSQKENNKIKNPKKVPATQQYLDIEEIRDGVVILRDGSLRGVIMVSSVNFALKADEEQESTIQSYVSFLNYLEHPVQIVVQSRRLNIDKYITQLAEREKEINNDLLRMQISDYRQFVTELVELGEIMSKKFYVVVPYSPMGDKRKGFMERVGSLFSPLTTINLKEKKFFELKEGLDKRLNTVESGLANMGLSTARLDTQALIELYYNSYNPEVFEQQEMTDVKNLQLQKN